MGAFVGMEKFDVVGGWRMLLDSVGGLCRLGRAGGDRGVALSCLSGLLGLGCCGRGGPRLCWPSFSVCFIFESAEVSSSHSMKDVSGFAEGAVFGRVCSGGVIGAVL